MGIQINRDKNTVKLFFCISGEIQSISLAKVQEKKPEIWQQIAL